MPNQFHLLRRWATALVAIGAVVHTCGYAQSTYPSRPVTMIVGWPAGGPADNVARLVANQMSIALGQAVVVDNRAGAGSNIASELAARAKNDGYTIMLATTASHGWNSALYARLNYRPIEDFAPIGLVNNSPGTLLVPANSPNKTLPDLIEAAKAQPGKLSFGSGGSGSSQHMAGAKFKKVSGIDILHVPYKGTAPAMTDLMAGRVDFIISTGAIPFIQSGKVRALAVTAPRRLPGLPDVPTFDEAGIKGFYTDAWYGLVAPADTPRPILERLNAALGQALRNPDVQKQFIEQGAFPAKPVSIDEFWAFVKNQMPEAAELVRSTGAKFE